MKKVAILSITVCQATESIIEYFLEKNYEINCVIIENNFRKKYSAREIEYRKKHDKFNRKTKKYSFIRRSARIIWDLMPKFLQKFIQQNIYKIPILNKVSLKKICKDKQIKVFEVAKHSSKKTVEIINNRNIDYMLMVSSNWLLKEPIISLQNTKIINAHSGWLPKYKGLDSIPWALKNGDKLGLTTHFVDAGIDSGDILKFYEAQIDDGDDFNQIKTKVGKLQPKAFYNTLIELENQTITPKKQAGNYKPNTPMSFKELCILNEKLKHNRL